LGDIEHVGELSGVGERVAGPRGRHPKSVAPTMYGWCTGRKWSGAVAYPLARAQAVRWPVVNAPLWASARFAVTGA
jgi:hypothetical protein